jgi:hypothetical protein
MPFSRREKSEGTSRTSKARKKGQKTRELNRAWLMACKYGTVFGFEKAAI